MAADPRQLPPPPQTDYVLNTDRIALVVVLLLALLPWYVRYFLWVVNH